MRRVRRKQPKNQSRDSQHAIPLDDGTMTTPAALALIRALIPLGLQAVHAALVAEVDALAGPRYARGDDQPDVVRWGAQRGSIYLADQKLPITVPRVRDRAAQCEVPLATYAALQTPRAHDVGLYRKVLGGLSCREYEAAAEAVPEAFGLAKVDGVAPLHSRDGCRVAPTPGAPTRRCRVAGPGARRQDVRRRPARRRLKAPPGPTIATLARLRRAGKNLETTILPNTDHGLTEFTLTGSRRTRTRHTPAYFPTMMNWVVKQTRR